LLERELLRANADAGREFFERYLGLADVVDRPVIAVDCCYSVVVGRAGFVGIGLKRLRL